MSKCNGSLTQERLKELLHYDRDTGDFTWAVGRRGVRKGAIAGSYQTKLGGTYRIIKVEWVNYKAHRLAWLYVYGTFPPELIDHHDGDGTNNRILNLHCCNHSQNSRNQKMPKNNKSGCIGVSWGRTSKKWKALISDKKKRIYLGVYADIDDAIKARHDAEVKYCYHLNHGRARSL